MATFTAHILVGHSHPNHGGISPSHALFLSENSRPTWILIPLGLPGSESTTGHNSITWVPTVEHMLEDALLMIAVHVLQERSIVERFQGGSASPSKTRYATSGTPVVPPGAAFHSALERCLYLRPKASRHKAEARTVPVSGSMHMWQRV